MRLRDTATPWRECLILGELFFLYFILSSFTNMISKAETGQGSGDKITAEFTLNGKRGPKSLEELRRKVQTLGVEQHVSVQLRGESILTRNPD